MRILIVKTSSLGDIIHTFNALQALRQHFPLAVIDWVVEKSFQEIVQAYPLVDHVMIVDTKKWRKAFWKTAIRKEVEQFRTQLKKQEYDFVFDFQGNLKSAWITRMARSEKKVGFGRSTVSEWPNLWVTNQKFNPPLGKNIREKYLFLVESVFGKQKEKKTAKLVLNLDEEKKQKIKKWLADPCLQAPLKIVVCPGAFWKNKTLPLPTLIDFLEKIRHKEKVAFIFIWGSEEEKKIAEILQKKFYEFSIQVPKLGFSELGFLMSQVNLVIAMDSFPLHLAGAVGTSTFSVFGPSSAIKYKPLGENHRFFQGVCPYDKSFESRCPILRTCKTGACLQQLSAERLIEKFYKTN